MIITDALIKTKLFFSAENNGYNIYGLKTYPEVKLNIKKIKSLNISKKKVNILDQNVEGEYFIIFSFSQNHKYKNELNLFFSRLLRGFKSELSQDKLSTLLNLIDLIKFKNLSKIGLTGELLYILQIPSLIEERVLAWHSSAEDLFDFTFDNAICEIKTTTSPSRRHTLNFRQHASLISNIQRNPAYISIVVNDSNKTESIKDLVDQIIRNLKHPLISQFQDKMTAYNDLINDEKFFDKVSSINSISQYNVREIPKLIEVHNSVMTDSLKLMIDFTKLDIDNDNA